MKPILTFFTIIMLFISSYETVPASNLPLPQLALVIGNSQYEYSRLTNPVNDATDMANLLKQIGFEVTLETDLNHVAMGEAISRFTTRISNSPGIGLFYFAGHGVQVDGHNYLVPIDNNKIGNKKDLLDHAVNVDDVLAGMEKARSHFNLIILDACRDDPFIGVTRSFSNWFRGLPGYSRGLARMDTSDGTLIAFATDKGKVADDRSVNRRNGLFTSHLLTALKTASEKQQRIDDMFMEVSRAVKKESRGKQVPWYTASLVTPFCFQQRAGIGRCSSFSITSTPTARYTDNGDGTVTDNRTRLIWLKDANCFGEKYWQQAKQSADNLAQGECGLKDGSRAGKWRLPTKEEWETIVDKNYVDNGDYYSQPALSNAVGSGPWKEGDPFYQVQPVFYWSGTLRSVSSTRSNAWYVDMSSGDVKFDAKRLTGLVWPVRGGP